MHLPSTSPARWIAGLAAACVMLGLMLVVVVSEAFDFSEPPLPLSTAAPNEAVKAQIRAFEAGTTRWADSPQAFVGPNKRTVYLFTPLCCDQFNPLYDEDGRYICAPSGGIAGTGDGRCPPWVMDGSMRSRQLPPRPRTEQPWPPDSGK